LERPGAESFAKAPLLIYFGSGLGMARAVAIAVSARVKRVEALILLV